MDVTTCEFLLGAVANGASSDDVAELYGKLSSNNGGTYAGGRPMV